MLKPILPAPSLRPAARRTRRVRPLVEGLEVRQTPTGTVLTSPLALVILNPQPLPPESSPTTYDFQPCPSAFYRIY